MSASRSRSAAVFALALALVTARPDRAGAEEPAANMAEKLFLEGRVLSDRGEIAAACLRFEKSHELDPKPVGPTLNLALCKEQLGNYASAATFFREVIEKSRDSRPDRVALAEQHLSSLGPKIAHLRVEVPEPRPVGLEVRVDGRVLPEASWGTDVPTDGGRHAVSAAAPHKRSATQSVTLGREAGRLVVRIAPLADLHETKNTGYAVGGAGLAAIALGAVVGGSVAVRCGGFFRSTCDAANGLPDADRSSTLRSLDTQAWVANVAVGLGIVAVAAGLYLVVTSTPAELSTAAR